MKNEAAQQLGKLGGNATKARHGVEHFRRIAKGWPKGKKRNVSGKTLAPKRQGVRKAEI
jgi:hypothetical protein